jgi:hypothetical protein
VRVFATQKIFRFQAQPVSQFFSSAIAESNPTPTDIPFHPYKLASEQDPISVSNTPSMAAPASLRRHPQLSHPKWDIA